jgi:hypothetical protein
MKRIINVSIVVKYVYLGKTPAQWASINNGIYLCINCSGEHRGYGVTISFMRSITIDTWYIITYLGMIIRFK